MFPSFTGLHRPVKGTKVSTVLSTPGQVTIPPSYLDIGMGGHFEGFGGCEESWPILRNFLKLGGPNMFPGPQLKASTGMP